MNTFTVALALAAIGAEASYHRGGYSAHGRPAYSQGTQGQHVHAQYYNPHAAPAAEEPFVQPHVSTHRYGSHANKTQYDRRYPDAHGNYNHGGLLPKYESPHSHLAHRHTETRDPWGDVQGTVTEDRDGWWSPHRQFSPPLVKYVPAALKSTVYAVCTLTTDTMTMTTGYVEIAQDPHRPSSIRADITYGSMASSANVSELQFDVYTTGDLVDADGVLDCDVAAYTEAQAEALGEIFHPLKEEKNGVVNPYADPWRGVISNKALNGGTSIDLADVQTDLLMDLGGVDSLIGRALLVTEIDTTADPQVNLQTIGCCIIARAAGPAATPAPANEVWQQSVHTQYHAADPQHEQHTHDAPTYGNDYGNSPAPQSGYKSYGHGSYSRYPQKSQSHHGAWY